MGGKESPNATAQAAKWPAWAWLLLGVALAFPLAVNRFALIFPDSGAYLRIAYGHYFGIERASGYGLALKPVLANVGGGLGPWLAIAVQIVAIAAIVVTAARRLAPLRVALPVLAVVALASSWPWHAAQFMPDAFTGPVVLLGWLSIRRDLGKGATVGVAIASILLLTMHVTHLPLFVASALVALAVEAGREGAWRGTLGRAFHPLFLAAVVVAMQVAGNAYVLGRASLAPGGPLFLYARLNEDGLIRPWLARHCGEERIALLCRVAPDLPQGSQDLLWAREGPVMRMVWQSGPADLDRWQLVDQMAIANRGAILDRPGAFLLHSLRGTVRQLGAFRPIDDECPQKCRPPINDIAVTLHAMDPPAARVFDRSAQATGGLPTGIVRALVTPVTALCLLLLPLVAGWAWRRRDAELASLSAAVLIALLANAALAGALSDVHDRYQSRVAWLAVLVVGIALARRNRVKDAAA